MGELLALCAGSLTREKLWRFSAWSFISILDARKFFFSL